MLDTLKEFFGIDGGYEEEDYEEYDPNQERMDGQTFINSSTPNNQPELTKIPSSSNHTNNHKQEMKLNNVIGMPGLANGNSEVVVQ